MRTDPIRTQTPPASTLLPGKGGGATRPPSGRDALRREAGAAGSYVAGAQVLKPAASLVPLPMAPAAADTTATAPQAGTPGLDDAALAALAASVVAQAPEGQQEYARTTVPAILRQCAMTGLRNPDQVAYVLATAQHESRFGTPQYSRSESLVEDRNPLAQGEDGSYSGTVHTTGRSVSGASLDEAETRYWDEAYGGILGNEEGTTDAKNFRGRGFVQLTGRSNYQRMTETLTAEGFTYSVDGVTYGGEGNPAIDLVSHPDHVNRVPDLAARILVRGMELGLFTGQSLGEHINENGADFENARSIVNGDVEENGATIATIARGFSTVLTEANAWASVFEPGRSNRDGVPV